MKLISEMLMILAKDHISEVPETIEEVPDFVREMIPGAKERTRKLVSAIKAGQDEEAFRLAQERMKFEELAWDRRVEYNERIKLIV